MTPDIRARRLTGPSRGRPTLVVGPSLGTSTATLWTECIGELGGAFDVIGWDLPGHGWSPAAGGPFTIAELAQGVLDTVGLPKFAYAGDSVGGAVGLQLLLDVPARVTSAVLICTGARIGSAEMWTARADQVLAAGTGSLVETSKARWFGPGFPTRRPEIADGLLQALKTADAYSYAQICHALCHFDVRDRLPEIQARVLCLAGADDVATPSASLRDIATEVARGDLVELPGIGHLAPAEAPVAVARLLLEHLS
jgi:3-oxoadipate enol-lactonase / 4-carboxymuconolactone decarboxylase